MKKKYIIVIGDLISSKRIQERKLMQRKLLKILNKVNTANTSIVSPYTLTLGDEFQAVYSKPSNLFRDLIFIEKNLYPVKIRLSIAIGSITTSLNKKQAIGMDGPVFHIARDKINELKKSSYRYVISTDDDKDLELYNSILKLISKNIDTWKPPRYGVLLAMLENKSIKEISKIVRIREQSVYKNIEAASIDILIKIYNSIETELEKILKIN